MVTLQFQRSPFHPIKRTVMVPWNEIIVIQTPIVMSAGADEVYTMDASLPDHDLAGYEQHHGSSTGTGSGALRLNRTSSTAIICQAHDYQAMKPLLFQRELPVGRAAPARPPASQETFASPESQVLQETLIVPGSSAKLVYQSSSSPGYLSTINLLLTGTQVPASLRLVHLRIVVEGNLFSKLFEAEPQIKFTYAWNKRNVYRQKVYGLATARGKCSHAFPSETRHIRISAALTHGVVIPFRFVNASFLKRRLEINILFKQIANFMPFTARSPFE